MPTEWEPEPDDPSKPEDRPLPSPSADPSTENVTWINGFPVKLDPGMSAEDARAKFMSGAAVNGKGVKSGSFRGAMDAALDGLEKATGDLRKRASIRLRAVGRSRAGSRTSNQSGELHVDPMVLPVAEAPDLARMDSSPNERIASCHEIRKQLVRLFRAHDPARVGQVDELMEQHVGMEEELLQELVSELGPVPDSAPSEYIGRVRGMYEHYSIPNSEQIEERLEDYCGREEDLLALLVDQYGPEPPNGADPPPAPADNNPHRERLRRFYTIYNPARLEMVDDALQQYEGREEVLFSSLVKKYGPEPNEDGTAAEGTPVRTRGVSVMAARRARHEDSSMESVGDSQQMYRDRLVRFYQAWNETKLPSVDQTLERYKGREEELFRQLVAKYGPEPVSIGELAARRRAKSEAARPVLNSPKSPKSWRSSFPAGLVPPIPSSKEAESANSLRARLTRFYTHHNPDKLSSIDQVIEAYANDEQGLFDKLVKKYGPEPPYLVNSNTMQIDEDARGTYAACLESSSPKRLQRLGSRSTPVKTSSSASLKSSSPKRKCFKVKVTEDAEKLKQLMSSSAKLPAWDNDYASWVGQVGTVLREDPAEKTVAVAFADGKGGWFPRAAVEEIPSDGTERSLTRNSSTTLSMILASPSKPSPSGNSVTGSFGGVHQSEGSSIGDPNDLRGSPAASFTSASPTAAAAPPMPPEKEGEKPLVKTTNSVESESGPTPPPAVLEITSGSYAVECAGKYKLTEDIVNGHPTWKRESSDGFNAWLFSTPAGEWKVTDDPADFETGDGYFNTEEHEGQMPHEMKEWLDEDDTVDTTIKVVAPPPVELEPGDRIMGGHKVVARVVAELTEEELQYASFQRRRKYKPKKTEVPISSKCQACRKFDAVCSMCFLKHRKAQQERREFLKREYSTWPLRSQVGYFYAAIVNGEDEDVKIMVEHGGADVNWMAMFKKRPDEDNKLPAEGCGVTPLHVACAYHQPDVVYVLLGKGARYRRDQNSMFPLDYVTDDNAHHDILMFLTEQTPEYNIAVNEVQEAWDIYHEGDFKEARDAFFELLMMYPTRDSCHLGLIYSHLALGALEQCIHVATQALEGKNIKWIECPESSVREALQKAEDIYHSNAHEEPTEGFVKKCGCVIFPEDWTVPLKKLRRADFSVIRRIFSWLSLYDAFQAWAAFWTMPLLKEELNMMAPTLSKVDRRQATYLCTWLPAWRAAIEEAIVDNVFETWDTKQQGELAHVHVEQMECFLVPSFLSYHIKVVLTVKHVSNTALSKIRNWWQKGDRRSSSTRASISAPAAPVASPVSIHTFKLKLDDDFLGLEFEPVGAVMRISGVAPDGPGSKAGVVPGLVRAVNGVAPTGVEDIQQAVQDALEKPTKELTLSVEVDIPPGTVVEVHGLTKKTELNGTKGTCVRALVTPSNEIVLQVDFGPPNGLVLIKSTNTYICFTPDEQSLAATIQEPHDEDDAVTSVSSPFLRSTVGTGTGCVSPTTSSAALGSSAVFSSTAMMSPIAVSPCSPRGDFPVPIPPKPSKNEALAKFQKESTKLVKKKEMRKYTVVVGIPGTDPMQLIRSTWPNVTVRAVPQ